MERECSLSNLSQVYKDTSGNGLGDIDGIIQKIGYIKSLGVDIIWLCPIYESPNDDNGYDISDYRRISDDFGGDESFDRLLKAIHNSGLKLIMDLVVNHTSDEHYWFEEAKKHETNIIIIIYGKRPSKTLK